MTAYVRQVRQWPRALTPRLGQLDLELTERCNNDCLHCCINQPAADARARASELTTAEIMDLLRQAAGLGCLLVRFTGGEPLLRPDFAELYLGARRLGLKVLLFTNARLITPPLADLFARIPPRAPIEITVYGMHPASYDAVTRMPGSFAQFWRGVQLLRERQVPFIVKSALLPPNQSESDEFEAWARTLPWMRKRPGYALFFDLRHRGDDAAKNRLIAALRPTPEAGLAALTRDDAGYRAAMAEFAVRFMGPPGDQLFQCGACAGSGACVDAYGRAQPCLALRAPELTVPVAGTPDRKSLREALERFARLHELRATHPDYLRRCARCFLKGLCEQCPAKAWSEHGTLDTPVEYLCAVAHAQARHLGFLAEGERAWEVLDWRGRVGRDTKTPPLAAGTNHAATEVDVG